jgi:hypothetical protein
MGQATRPERACRASRSRRGLVIAMAVALLALAAGGVVWLGPGVTAPAGAPGADEAPPVVAQVERVDAPEPAPDASDPAHAPGGDTVDGPSPTVDDPLASDSAPADPPEPEASSPDSSTDADPATDEDENVADDADDPNADALDPPTFATVVARRGTACGPSFGDPRYTYVIAWEAPGAEQVMLDVGDGHAPVGDGETGHAEICGAPGDAVQLRAVNPAGTAEQDVSLG